ncbi:MAG TPA: hypothetical protein VNX01_14075 [Bacteroidia bacterium]|jgi:hypothetical protein|nr:hypothetical protein [Bacteroidia bacterium]
MIKKILILFLFIVTNANLLYAQRFKNDSIIKCDGKKFNFIEIPEYHFYEDIYAYNHTKTRDIFCSFDYFIISYTSCKGDAYMEVFTKDSVLKERGFLKSVGPFLGKASNMDKPDSVISTFDSYYLERTGKWEYFDAHGKLIKTKEHVPVADPGKLNKKRMNIVNKRCIEFVKKINPESCKLKKLSKKEVEMVRNYKNLIMENKEYDCLYKDKNGLIYSKSNRKSKCADAPLDINLSELQKQ